MTTETDIKSEEKFSETGSLNKMTTDEFMHRLFDKYDGNADGRLSWFEFTQIIKFLTRVLGVTFPKKYDLEDIFAQIDNDGDKTVNK